MEFVVKQLPEAYRRALNAVGYAKRSIEIRPQQTYALQGPSGAGLQNKAGAISITVEGRNALERK